MQTARTSKRTSFFKIGLKRMQKKINVVVYAMLSSVLAEHTTV